MLHRSAVIRVCVGETQIKIDAERQDGHSHVERGNEKYCGNLHAWHHKSGQVHLDRAHGMGVLIGGISVLAIQSPPH
jgi:hypothetical protein